MTKPLGVEIDFESKAAYVCYSKADVAETLEIWEDATVAADVDAWGKVIGIEVLSFDDETLLRARRYAQEHGLAFPSEFKATP